MRFGVTLPNLGVGADPRILADLALDAERAGWDGVFVWDAVHSAHWDAVYRDDPHGRATLDPWIMLAAIATRTERVRIGAVVTPLSRRRPWKVARETVTLDHLSDGRLILSVGLGSLGDGAISKVGEPTERTVRARKLDEGLAILAGLWSGRPLSYRGEHYRVDEMTFWPPPRQSPRIPVWVVGAWPRPASMRRAARWDGVIASRMTEGGDFVALTPAEVRTMRAWIAERRPAGGPYDIVLEGTLPGDDPAAAAETVRPYAEAGVTWWLEDVWQLLEGPVGAAERMRARIRQGPPRR